MEIIDPCCSVLSNFEVMEALKNFKDTKKKYGLRNLATITYETLQYLEDDAGAPSKHQSRESIQGFLIDVRPYNLTTNECLTMVNDPPSCALHIQLLIEDSEERLTEEQVNELLAIVKRRFPGNVDETEK